MTKKKRYMSTRRRTTKQRKKSSMLLNKPLEKYYYTYYKGWCEDDGKILLFPTASSAMIWQVYQLKRDGYCQLFSDFLPLTFSIIGVVEVYKCIDDKDVSDLLSCIYDIQEYIISSSNQKRKSQVLERFLTNMVAYTPLDNERSIFLAHVARTYCQKMDNISFEKIQRLFSNPDYYSSTYSIVRNTTARNTNLYCDCNLVSAQHSQVYHPHCFDTFGFRICIATDIKKELMKGRATKNDTNISSKYILNESTVEELSLKHSRLLPMLRSTRIIISIGSGTACTELHSIGRNDYIFCLEISKRDTCTAILCSRLLANQENQRSSRVVPLLYDMKDVNVLQKFINQLYQRTQLQPCILFQHPSPSALFISNDFSPAINHLLLSLKHRIISKIVFVYDSYPQCEDKSSGTFFTKVQICEIIYANKHIAYEKLNISDEIVLSSKGQEMTLHPLFPLYKRHGWSLMKNKNEYCFEVCRK